MPCRPRLAIGATIALVGSIVACETFRSGPSYDAAPASCTELHQQFLSIASTLDRTCTEDPDCITVGGGAGSASDCECDAFIAGSCDGVSVRASSHATVATTLDALEAQFGARCRRACWEVPCICDCWAPAPVCFNGQCAHAFGPFCNPPPPPVDAAVDANLDAS